MVFSCGEGVSVLVAFPESGNAAGSLQSAVSPVRSMVVKHRERVKQKGASDAPQYALQYALPASYTSRIQSI